VNRIRSQIRYRLVLAGAWLLCRLPERPLMAVADAFGGVWYRLAPGRRRTARANLARVTRWMAEHEVGSERGRMAGRDPRVLEALVKDAFRHSVRLNLILARGPIIDAKYVARWMVMETPEVMESALAEPNGALFVGLHMGSNELPALYLALKTGRPSWAPTQTLGDPLLQAYMVRSRGRLGLRLVELQSARRELAEALRRGDPVGILADRDFTGGGIEVPLFGANASLPIGGALLALETGAVPHAFGVRRDENGIYRLRLERVPLPDEGSRRERVTGYLAAEARAFEHFIAAAPEQWFAIFFPIWSADAAAAEGAHTPGGEAAA
jgi:KDO2-lipid IV(A) lauroyltransferase